MRITINGKSMEITGEISVSRLLEVEFFYYMDGGGC
jgi:sulfur carrier protein ThiS